MKAEKNISSSEIVKDKSEPKPDEEKKPEEETKPEDPSEKLLNELEKVPE